MDGRPNRKLCQGENIESYLHGEIGKDKTFSGDL